MGTRPLCQIMQAYQTDQTLLLNTGRDKFDQILMDNNLAVKPHQGLNGLCPVKFERIIQNIPLCQRTSDLFKKVI